MNTTAQLISMLPHALATEIRTVNADLAKHDTVIMIQGRQHKQFNRMTTRGYVQQYIVPIDNDRQATV